MNARCPALVGGSWPHEAKAWSTARLASRPGLPAPGRADVVRPTDRQATTPEVIAGVAAVACLGSAFLIRSKWSDVLLRLALAFVAVPFLLHTWVPSPIAVLIGAALLLLAGRRAVELMRGQQAAVSDRRPDLATNR